MKKVSYALAIVGVLMLVYAVVGRFISEPTVLGWLPPPGFPMQPKSLVIGANSVLLLAVLASLCSLGRKCKEENKQ